MGQELPPFYGKSKFYVRKKQKALAKIEKLQKVIEECDKNLNKDEK